MKNEILMERFFLFDPNMCIVNTFDVLGGAKPQPLVEATRRAFTAFEATMSKIVLTDTGKLYYEKLPTSCCTAQITQSDFNDLIKYNFKKQLQINNGELIKVYVKDENDKLSVLIIAHHLVGDGKSITYLIERIMQEYIGDCDDECRPLKLLNNDTLPVNTRISKFYELIANYYKKQWAKDGKVFNWTDRKKLIDNYWQNREPAILKKQFNPECVNKIHAKSKDAKVSMNTWILTAFMKENKRYNSTNVPIATRIDGNRSISNQVTSISVRYSYNDKLTFEQNAQRLQKLINANISKPSRKYLNLRLSIMFAPLFDSVLMYTFGHYNNSTSKKFAAMTGYMPLKTINTLSTTNLGRLDIADKYGDFWIENFCFIPPLLSHEYQTIGIATMSSGMMVTLHSLDDRCTNEEKQMFNRTLDFLKN